MSIRMKIIIIIKYSLLGILFFWMINKGSQLTYHCGEVINKYFQQKELNQLLIMQNQQSIKEINKTLDALEEVIIRLHDKVGLEIPEEGKP